MTAANERLAFDVYATVTESGCQVEHDELDRRVMVTFGGPSPSCQPRNTLHLWFTNPLAVVALGRELVAAGERFRHAEVEKSSCPLSELDDEAGTGEVDA